MLASSAIAGAAVAGVPTAPGSATAVEEGVNLLDSVRPNGKVGGGYSDTLALADAVSEFASRSHGVSERLILVDTVRATSNPDAIDIERVTLVDTQSTASAKHTGTVREVVQVADSQRTSRTSSAVTPESVAVTDRLIVSRSAATVVELITPSDVLGNTATRIASVMDSLRLVDRVRSLMAANAGTLLEALLIWDAVDALDQPTFNPCYVVRKQTSSGVWGQFLGRAIWNDQFGCSLAAGERVTLTFDFTDYLPVDQRIDAIVSTLLVVTSGQDDGGLNLIPVPAQIVENGRQIRLRAIGRPPEFYGNIYRITVRVLLTDGQIVECAGALKLLAT